MPMSHVKNEYCWWKQSMRPRPLLAAPYMNFRSQTLTIHKWHFLCRQIIGMNFLLGLLNAELTYLAQNCEFWPQRRFWKFQEHIYGWIFKSSIIRQHTFVYLLTNYFWTKVSVFKITTNVIRWRDCIYRLGIQIFGTLLSFGRASSG